jgi:hypothetical protein
MYIASFVRTHRKAAVGVGIVLAALLTMAISFLVAQTVVFETTREERVARVRQFHPRKILARAEEQRQLQALADFTPEERALRLRIMALTGAGIALLLGLGSFRFVKGAELQACLTAAFGVFIFAGSFWALLQFGGK